MRFKFIAKHFFSNFVIRNIIVIIKMMRFFLLKYKNNFIKFLQR